MKIYWENEIEELDTSKELNFERIYIYIYNLEYLEKFRSLRGSRIFDPSL